MMCIRDMIDEMGCYELDRSVTARMGISKNGIPVKAVSMHHGCSTPLWKVIIVMLSVMLTMATFCYIVKKCRCKD